jgi:hypothetical protein
VIVDDRRNRQIKKPHVHPCVFSFLQCAHCLLVGSLEVIPRSREPDAQCARGNAANDFTGMSRRLHAR